MLKILGAIGILLLLPSISALYWCESKQDQMSQQRLAAKTKVRAQADEFAVMMHKLTDPGEFEKMRRNNPESIDRLRTQQRQRLLADIDELASGIMVAPEHANVLYGSGWAEQAAKYRGQKDVYAITWVAAVGAAALGGLSAGTVIFVLLVKLLMKLMKVPGWIMSKLRRRVSVPELMSNEKFAHVRSEAATDQQKIAVSALLQEINTNIGAQRAVVENRIAKLGEDFKAVQKAQGDALAKELRDAVGGIPEKLNAAIDGVKGDNGETARLTEMLEHTLTQTRAITKTVDDFTAQFNAIRDYAAYQQQRLARLEDGYDWNIIKHICMRVIRCIDNLHARIAELEHLGVNTGHLRELRDELSFVLESSGVEAFGARVNSDYQGQQNRMQVLDEKEPTDDPSLAGKIAEVVRPGYLCVLSDERVKVVRPAQVRLYGAAAELVEVAG